MGDARRKEREERRAQGAADRAHRRHSAGEAHTGRRHDTDDTEAEDETAAANSSDIVSKRRREEEEKKLRSVRTRSYTQNQGYDVRQYSSAGRPHTTFNEKHINPTSAHTARREHATNATNNFFLFAIIRSDTQQTRMYHAATARYYIPTETNPILPTP